MRRFGLVIMLFGLPLQLYAQPLHAQTSCGTERWDVKVMRDPMSARVFLDERYDTQIDLLAALMPPDPPVRGTERRGVGPEEWLPYTVVGTPVVAKLEADRDVHLGLQDGAAAMIAEVIDPACATGSLVLTQIQEARSALESLIGGTPTPLRLKTILGKKLRVTGVGFYDRIHGQAGRAPNGLELHPVIALEEVHQ